MLKAYKIVRFLIVTAIMMVTVVPVGCYVALSLPVVQRQIARQLEDRLSDFLGVDVAIGDFGLIPFNRVALRDVSITTTEGDTIAHIAKLGAGVSIYSVLMSDHISVNYLELLGMDARISRATPHSPLNIDPILQALAPSDPNKPPTPFDFKVNTIVIRRSGVRYDVLSEPTKEHFDPNHIALSDFQADLRLPLMRNNDFTIDLKRISFEERSGFALTDMTGLFHVADTVLSARRFSLSLPASVFHFDDITIPLKSLKQIGEALSEQSIALRIADGSHVALADLAPFVSQLKESPYEFGVSLDAEGNTRSVELRNLQLEAIGHRTSLSLVATVDSPLDKESMRVDVPRLRLFTTGREAKEIAQLFAPLTATTAAAMDRAGDITLTADIDGTAKSADLKAKILSGLGDATVEMTLNAPSKTTADADLDLQIVDVNLAALLGRPDLGKATAKMSASIERKGKSLYGPAEIDVDAIDYKGHTYRNLQTKLMLDGDRCDLQTRIDDDLLGFFVNATVMPDYDNPQRKAIRLHSSLTHMRPEAMGLTKKYPGYTLKTRVDASLSATNIDDVTGRVFVNDIEFSHPDNPSIEIYRVAIESQADSAKRTLTLNSDVLEGRVEGQFAFSTIGDVVASMVAEVYPVFVDDRPRQRLEAKRARRDIPLTELTYKFTLLETDRYQEFLRWPVSVLFPVDIEGILSESRGVATLNVDAPYLRQKKKLIEATNLYARLDSKQQEASLTIETQYPTKNGPMRLTVDNSGSVNALRTAIDWKIDRAQAYEGVLDLATYLERDEADRLLVTLDLGQSELVFNDAVWTVNPARVTYADRWLNVDGIDIHRDNQFVKIDGTASQSPDDILRLSLLNLNLDYVFETLGIDAVMLGGDATGEFEASQLFTQEPHIETPGLEVKGISYNKQVFGDAVVRSHWDPETRGITINALIDEPEGRKARIDGAIYPLSESLDITFDVDKTPIGFLGPYLDAFASDIDGYASGRLRLFGTFKYVDMEGDVLADDVSMKIRFTNTTYWASDSVHMRPGLIDLNGISIRDAEGHTAKLGGWVRHKFFKEPSFDIALTDAHNFLSYRETARENPVWHGRIYGNGSAYVRGYPGVVDITVDMSTAPNSTFTFVLTDMQEASEYSFLTFRNVTVVEASDTIEARANPMYLVNRFRSMLTEQQEEHPSAYNINLQMRITPEAQINLVMDPVAGDRIRSRGSGHLRMEYGSANNDLKMFGTYTLESGDYNFTLQDIIIKDFTISEGGKITFNGDPYSAQLDLRAVYSLNANLSDLDESFTQDNDLNRTNVPVHALMFVTGDIRQPEISFDLEFPTLTQDTYRKVKSIVSTPDMMNRQIIYLLALNRFYTPDYMGSANRGNEMVSLASSTISSQLGSILGQLSDNWSIAPNFRSDRGDFSDMEVDVALSSRLLNNRLLFNGNFGYRDNALNTTQFIGDFDLEYLLNRKGNIRLKAYNRYNDQNYFLRTANTTQGVGVMFKHDFDNILGTLLRRKKSADDSK